MKFKQAEKRKIFCSISNKIGCP